MLGRVYQLNSRCASHKGKVMESDIKYMLDNTIAVLSSASWGSPCLLVDKSNWSPRFCTDYWKVNKTTKPDSYSLPRMHDCIDQDLLKGYWQVPLSACATEISAFVTPTG